MKKNTKYVMLLMTALVISTAAVSCSKDSENEPDPTPTPTPNPKPDPTPTPDPTPNPETENSILGIWKTEKSYPGSSKRIDIIQMKDVNNITHYMWEELYGTEVTYTDNDMWFEKYVYDEEKELFLFIYSFGDYDDDTWEWKLCKVVEHTENTLVLAYVQRHGYDYPDVYGPYDEGKCQDIINFYKDQPYDSSDMSVYKRISEDELMDWWSSVQK